MIHVRDTFDKNQDLWVTNGTLYFNYLIKNWKRKKIISY